ncbi:small ribosomal subunit protein uS15m isoform X1 [Pleurodeles waltl]|uniref:small ribosomal subunit protein uS15m isoform X1 n=1 Tax=Pleurodeles waltl TaxID=8319 RepID=UPI003709B460
MFLARRVLFAICRPRGCRRFSGHFLISPLSAAARAGSGSNERTNDGRGNCSSLLVSVRHYAKVTSKKPEFPSQLDDLPPTMLQKDYATVKIAESVDDVVKRLLSLEMASQREKMQVKIQQLVDMVKRNPYDFGSTEVKIAKLTAKIRNYQEHLQKHPKDKLHKRCMLMSIDRRKKLLKYLRRTRYDVFENVCQKLDIEYTFPPQYYKRITHRWLAKKAFCQKVYQEAKKRREAERLKQTTVVADNDPPSVGTPV